MSSKNPKPEPPPFKPVEEAFKIIEDLHVHILGPNKNAEIISWDPFDEGVYVLGYRPVRQEAQWNYMKERDDYGDEITSHHIREIEDAVRRNAPQLDPADLNDPQREIIVFNKGVLDLGSMELRDHSPEDFYTIRIPHDYNENARCPKFDQFMSQILPSESRTLVGQLIGHLLVPSTKHRKFFVFLGEGGNGKSTLIEVIVSILGARNVSHQPLHQLVGNRFAVYELLGKLGNFYADIESLTIKEAGALKSIVGGDRIPYERKHRAPIYGLVTARLVFSANKMPVIKDETLALFDRLIPLEFPYRFVGEGEKKDLILELTTEEELEGIIARYAIPGLLNLQEENGFNVPARSQELLSEYRLRVDPIADFLEQHTKKVPDGWVPKDDLYALYRSWCSSEGVTHRSRREFNQRISEYLGENPSSDFREPEGRRRIWRGMIVSDPLEAECLQVIPKCNRGESRAS